MHATITTGISTVITMTIIIIVDTIIENHDNDPTCGKVLPRLPRVVLVWPALPLLDYMMMGEKSCCLNAR